MSHYYFIPIHKCPFVKKHYKNTIIDTLQLKIRGLKYMYFVSKFCEESVTRGLSERTLKNRIRAVTNSYELHSP